MRTQVKAFICRRRGDPRVRRDRHARANRGRRGAGSRTVRRPAHVLGRSRSARNLGLPHDHADGAPARARRPRVLHRRGNRAARRSCRAAHGAAARREHACQPRPRRVPDRPRPLSRRVTPHIADRRSAERPHAGADGRCARAASCKRARPRPRHAPAVARTPTPTALCSSAASRGDPRARRCRRSTTTISASFRRRATSRSSTRWCTRRGSCSSTAARSATCAATWANRAAGGKATRWSSRRAISTARRPIAAPAPTCESSSVTRAPPPTRSTSRSRSRTTHSGRSPGRPPTRCARPKASCTNTRATKATMACATSSRTRATKSGRPRPRRVDERACESRIGRRPPLVLRGATGCGASLVRGRVRRRRSPLRCAARSPRWSGSIRTRGCTSTSRTTTGRRRHG